MARAGSDPDDRSTRPKGLCDRAGADIMRVLIDANPLFPLGPGLGPTGVGRWARGAISSLASAAPDWKLELTAFHLRDLRLDTQALGNNVSFRVGRFPNRAYRKLRGLDLLPPVEWLLGPVDAMLGPAFVTWRSRRAAEIPVIHDLAFLRYPESVSRRNLLFLRWNVPRVVRRAPVVVTVSETMREEILDEFNLPADRVHVVRNGCDPSIFNPRAASVIESKLPERYLVFVGTLEPRKNLPAALDAIETLRRQSGDCPPLVVVGGVGWRAGPLEERLQRAIAAGAVIALGYLPDEALAAVYAKATALVFPSLYEGFGLPVIEAMACGCPVIASNRGALPEVAGDAAILVDPDDRQALGAAIQRVSSDDAMREALSARGRLHAEAFTWNGVGVALRRAIEHGVEIRRTRTRRAQAATSR